MGIRIIAGKAVICSVMRAKKSYGQHFLTDDRIALRIAQAIPAETDAKAILEIGPGTGALTQYLVDHPLPLFTVDADIDMVNYLREEYPHLASHMLHANFLKLDLADSIPTPFILIGNYPYNISSQIVFKMLEHRESIPAMIGMFQKEVAQRIVSSSGSKVYGIISVLVQAFYNGEYLFSVKPGSFVPSPKVNSGVIRLVRKERLDLGVDHSRFKSVVKCSFNQRRKMMRNTLKPLVSDPQVLKEKIFSRRPEQLSVEEFVQVTKMIS